MKTILYALLLTSVVVLLLNCSSEDSNPYLSADPGAVVVHRSFDDGATIPVFSTENLSLTINLKERVDSIRIHISANRLWNSADSVIPESRFHREPFQFLFSFKDTGGQTVSVTSYLKDGDSLIQQYSVKAVSPLSQESVIAMEGDTIKLSTPSVKDAAFYVWDFNDGTVIKENGPSAQLILKAPFSTKFGELYVTDFNGNRSPSVFFDLIARVPGRPAVRFATRVGDLPQTLRAEQDHLSLDLKINSQTGTAPFRFDVRIDGSPLSGSEAGQIRWNPSLQDVGARNFRILVTDSAGTSDTLIVQITVRQPDVVSVSFKSDSFHKSESASLVRVEVLLSARIDQTVVVPYAVDWTQSGAVPQDVSFSQNQLTFHPGDTLKYIEFTIVDDNLVEDNETLVLQLNAPVGFAVLGEVNKFTLHIDDNDKVGAYFTSAHSQKSETDNTATMIVALSKPLDRNIELELVLDSSRTTATSNQFNYQSPLKVTFPAGQTQATAVVNIINNDINEGTRSLVFHLVNNSSLINLVGNTTHTITVVDDDPDSRQVSFVNQSLAGSESVGSVTVKVKLSSPLQSPVTIQWDLDSSSSARLDGDFSLPQSRVLSFAPGSTEQSIVVSIIDDSSIEQNETVVLRLSAVPAGWTQGTSVFTYTIFDDDAPSVVQVGFASTVSEGEESQSSATILVRLSNSSTASITVPVSISSESTANSGHFSINTDALVFRPGETEKTVSLTVNNNDQKDGNRTVVIDLGAPSAFAELGSASRHIYTIRDNDFDLLVQSEPQGYGTVIQRVNGSEASSPFEKGTQVELVPVPAPGYRFQEWAGDLSGNADPATVHIDNDKAIVARFVLALPVIQTQPQDQNVREGESARFSVVASGNDLTYRWQKNGADIPGANGAELVLDAVSRQDSGSVYRCIISNPSGEVVSSEAKLHVRRSRPHITEEPQSSTVNDGGSAQFSLQAEGDALQYNWYKNGVEVGSNQNSLTFTASTADNGAEIYCIVSNAGGSDTSAVVHLTVIVNAPSIIDHPLNQSAIVGQTVTFSVSATGSDLHFQWQRNNQNIDGAQTNQLSFVVQAQDAGARFRCVVTNSAGSAVSDSAILSVMLPPVIDVHPQNQSGQIGETVTFSVSASGTGLSYQWQMDGQNIEGANASQLSFTVQESDFGAFRCVVSNDAGSVISQSAQLTESGVGL